MTIRTVNTDTACATTFGRLDDSLTVARTEGHTLLLNLPRNIDDLAEATGAKENRGFFSRLFGR